MARSMSKLCVTSSLRYLAQMPDQIRPIALKMVMAYEA